MSRDHPSGSHGNRASAIARDNKTDADEIQEINDVNDLDYIDIAFSGWSYYYGHPELHHLITSSSARLQLNRAARVASLFASQRKVLEAHISSKPGGFGDVEQFLSAHLEKAEASVQAQILVYEAFLATPTPVTHHLCGVAYQGATILGKVSKLLQDFITALVTKRKLEMASDKLDDNRLQLRKHGLINLERLAKEKRAPTSRHTDGESSKTQAGRA